MTSDLIEYLRARARRHWLERIADPSTLVGLERALPMPRRDQDVRDWLVEAENELELRDLLEDGDPDAALEAVSGGIKNQQPLLTEDAIQSDLRGILTVLYVRARIAEGADPASIAWDPWLPELTAEAAPIPTERVRRLAAYLDCLCQLDPLAGACDACTVIFDARRASDASDQLLEAASGPSKGRAPESAPRVSAPPVDPPTATGFVCSWIFEEATDLLKAAEQLRGVAPKSKQDVDSTLLTLEMRLSHDERQRLPQWLARRAVIDKFSAGEGT